MQARRLSKTERELADKIARWRFRRQVKELGLADGRPDETTLDTCSVEERQAYLDEAKEEIDLFKAALPELAKAAGYVKLTDDQHGILANCSGHHL